MRAALVLLVAFMATSVALAGRLRGRQAALRTALALCVLTVCALLVRGCEDHFWRLYDGIKYEGDVKRISRLPLDAEYLKGFDALGPVHYQGSRNLYSRDIIVTGTAEPAEIEQLCQDLQMFGSQPNPSAAYEVVASSPALEVTWIGFRDSAQVTITYRSSREFRIAIYKNEY